MLIDTEFAFNRYEQIRHRLPSAQFPAKSIHTKCLLDIANDFDVFLFDAFGVLNVGNTCIDGAPDAVKSLRAMGKHTFVVTNAGSAPKQNLIKKYASMGYQFTTTEVMTSREQMCQGVARFDSTSCWGVAAPEWSGIESFDFNCVRLLNDETVYADVDGFIFLGSHNWNASHQSLMLQSLHQHKRPVLVGNPDLIAPRENGFSLEPGFYAHDIADQTGIQPSFFGKPFHHVFDQVKSRFDALDPNRVLMIGDTLHTDILGGTAAGFKTALVSDHGLFKGHCVNTYIQRCNIVPDYILPSI